MSYPTLKAGMRAYYDAFGGLVPVRVLSIKHREGAAMREIRPSSEHNVTARVLQDCAGWKKGERIEAWSLHVVPCAAIKRWEYSTRIGFYNVECDE